MSSNSTTNLSSSDPYEVLGLSPAAGEAEVRRRYLELVREFSPDRAPEQFAAIRGAYEALRDPGRRLHGRIFEYRRHESLEGIEAELRARLRRVQVPVQTLLDLAEAP